MGKVGSTSITASLKETNYFPIHIHSFFTPLSTDMYQNYHSIKYYRTWSYRMNYYLKNQLILSLFKKRKKLKIITLTREPISRNASMYFHAFHVPLMDINKFTDNRKESNTNLPSFRQDFYDKFNHQYGINWFDHEFKRAWGVDVYDYPFNQDQGYSIIKKGNMEILVLQMEKLDHSEEVIRDFLELEEFELKRENTGNKKWYHSVYKEFKQGLYPEDNYIENLYNSKFMQHFYHNEDIEAYRSKFKGKHTS